MSAFIARLVPGIIWVVAFILGTYFLLFLLQMTRRASARKAGSRQILEYGWPVRVLGVFMLLAGVAALYGASRSSPHQRSLFWILAGALTAVGIHTCLKVFLGRIEFDDSFIYTFSPWQGRREVPWVDIISCQFSKADRCFILGTRAHGQVRVPMFFSGIKSFVEKVGEKGYA